MIGLPLTGWIMVSTSKLPIPTRLYGMVPWPVVPGFTGFSPATKAAWNGASNTGHTLLVFVTVAMLALHLGAVAKHQFVDRDGVFARMAPGAKSGWKEPRLWTAAALALAAILIGHDILGGSNAGRHEHEQARAAAAPVVAVAPVAAADAPVAAATLIPEKPEPLPPHWRMQDGTLRFATTWSGAGIAGGFSRWSPEIIFSPDNLARSSLTVRIDVTSVSTGDSQRDAALPTADWFDAATHPSAIFRSRNIRSAGGDNYVAIGTLDLRGVRHSVSVPFSVRIVNGSATAQGAFTIDRTLFRVGQGEWSATDQIPAGVRVSFAIRANAPR
jgi:polyisoprenoid-binding protein YceI